MRTLIAIVFLLTAATASSQTLPSTAGPDTCWPSAHVNKVVVQMADGTSRRGLLLCLGTDHLTLAEPQAIGQIHLTDVRHVRRAADPVWDGAAKGAAVGLLFLVLCGGHCPVEVVLRTTAGYGLLGLVIDAVDTNAETIYRAPPERHATVGFRMSF